MLAMISALYRFANALKYATASSRGSTPALYVSSFRASSVMRARSPQDPRASRALARKSRRTRRPRSPGQSLPARRKQFLHCIGQQVRRRVTEHLQPFRATFLRDDGQRASGSMRKPGGRPCRRPCRPAPTWPGRADGGGHLGHRDGYANSRGAVRRRRSIISRFTFEKTKRRDGPRLSRDLKRVETWIAATK